MGQIFMWIDRAVPNFQKENPTLHIYYPDEKDLYEVCSYNLENQVVENKQYLKELK